MHPTILEQFKREYDIPLEDLNILNNNMNENTIPGGNEMSHEIINQDDIEVQKMNYSFQKSIDSKI